MFANANALMRRSPVDDLADEIEARLRSFHPLPPHPSRADLVQLVEARGCRVLQVASLGQLGGYLHTGRLGIVLVQLGLPDCLAAPVLAHELGHHEQGRDEEGPHMRHYTTHPRTRAELVAQGVERRLCPSNSEARPPFGLPAAPVWPACELTHGYTLCVDARSEPWLHGRRTQWPKILRTVQVRPWPVPEWREILVRYRDTPGVPLPAFCAAHEAIRRWDLGSGLL